MFNEREVISKILNGDIRAFEVLVKQYERLVFHVISRLVSDEGDKQDICQEVFIKVHKNLDTFRFQSKLSTWIARIAYLTGINYVKKYKRHVNEHYPENPDNYYFTADDPQELMMKKDVSEYMNMLIQMMPEQYRALLTLFHLNEFSYQEIEEITGLPEGTIKSYLFRARKLLKEKLEAYLKKEIA